MYLIRRSRWLSVLLVFGIACAGSVAALAAVPHGHDHDLDHSKHTACPVHQIEQQGFLGLPSSFALPVILTCLVFLVLPKITFFQQTTFFRLSSRAPPAWI